VASGAATIEGATFNHMAGGFGDLSDFFTLLLPDTAARLANHRTNPAIAKAKRLFWCKSADLIGICRFRIVSLAVSDFFALQARF